QPGLHFLRDRRWQFSERGQAGQVRQGVGRSAELLALAGAKELLFDEVQAEGHGRCLPADESGCGHHARSVNDDTPTLRPGKRNLDEKWMRKSCACLVNRNGRSSETPSRSAAPSAAGPFTRNSLPTTRTAALIDRYLPGKLRW